MLAIYIYHLLYVMKTGARQTRSFILKRHWQLQKAFAGKQGIPLAIVKRTKPLRLWLSCRHFVIIYYVVFAYADDENLLILKQEGWKFYVK